jgi:hypothetical protein
VVVPLEGGRFGIVNRMTGELAVIDPATADTRMIEMHITSRNRRTAPLIAGADGNIWFLISGASANRRELIQFATNGKVLPRYALHLPADFKSFKLAISGRDVYTAGFTATVYRYELPQ